MKKIIFAVLMLLTGMVFAQYIQNVGMIDGATGNLVYTSVNPPPPGADPFTWSGFGTTTSNGGGLSGGWQPAYNPSTGTFMFGYNQGTVAYSTPVNYALSMAGTNIQVNGFKYSWEYYNQDMSRGTLSANVNLTNTSGQVLQNYNYNMPYTTNGWTKYSGTENFNTQYPGSYIGNLNVSFTGKDDRWWAGYYGPQVRAIDVSLLYSVAPPPVQTDFVRWVPLTNENGTFTLETAGVVRYGANGTYVYANFQPGTYSCSNSAWGIDPLSGVGKACDLGSNQSPTPTPTPIPTTTTTTTVDYTSGVALQDPVTTTAPNASTTSPTTASSSASSDTSTSTSTAQPGTVTASPTIVSAPSPTTTSSSSTTTSSSSSTTSSASSSSKESSGSSGGSNVGLALSVIGKNSERDAAGSAVAQSAMAQAQAAATQAQQEATSVAASAVANSVAANIVSSGGPAASGTGIKVTGSSSSSQSAISISMGTVSVNSVTGSVSTFATAANTQQSIDSMTSSVAIQVSNNIIAVTPTGTGVTQMIDSYSMVPPNFLTDKTNPLTDIIEGKQQVPQNSTTAIIGPNVNKDASDNDIAGGVSINKMALAPMGYGDYLNFTMRDASFYAPKEVYKNQRNVDNARALRQMTNDSKHREMVELQYVR